MTMVASTARRRDPARLSESELIAAAVGGDAAAMRHIVQSHNRRLYRVARAVLHDDSEAEDVVQDAYVRAFSTLANFRGESGLGTWLTRIALNEALGRLRRRQPGIALDAVDTPEERARMHIVPFPLTKAESDPECEAARQETRRLLERAIDDLAEPFRLVFVLRDVEQMTVEETAQQLGLRPETVRSRLHRAHARLRRSVASRFASALSDAFPFGGTRCARTTDAVMRRLAERNLTESTTATEENG